MVLTFGIDSLILFSSYLVGSSLTISRISGNAIFKLYVN